MRLYFSCNECSTSRELNVHRYSLNDRLDPPLFWATPAVWIPPVPSPISGLPTKPRRPLLTSDDELHAHPLAPGLRRAALWQPNRLGVSSVCSPLRPPLGPPGGPPGDLHSLPQHTEAPCMVGGKDGTPPCLFPSLTTFRSPPSSGLNKLNNFYELSAPPSLPFLESPSKCSSFWVLLQMFKYSGLFRSSPAP